LGDFLVENRACSTWTIKSDDFSGRQIRPISARQTTDFCWPVLLADEIGQLCRWSILTVLSAAAEQVDDVDVSSDEFHDFHLLHEITHVTLRRIGCTAKRPSAQ